MMILKAWNGRKYLWKLLDIMICTVVSVVAQEATCQLIDSFSKDLEKETDKKKKKKKKYATLV